jgi:hypothetical protein
VKQVLASLPVRTIQRLTQTYLTLSLADIARAAGLAGPPEAEAVILRMVAHRQVFARINDRDGMVTFMQVRQVLDPTVEQSISQSFIFEIINESIDRSFNQSLIGMAWFKSCRCGMQCCKEPLQGVVLEGWAC